MVDQSPLAVTSESGEPDDGVEQRHEDDDRQGREANGKYFFRTIFKQSVERNRT